MLVQEKNAITLKQGTRSQHTTTRKNPQKQSESGPISQDYELRVCGCSSAKTALDFSVSVIYVTSSLQVGFD